MSDTRVAAEGLLDGLYGLRFPPAREGVPPSDEELEQLLAAAAAVPDHGHLHPWRFVVIAGAARDRLADALAHDTAAATPDIDASFIERARNKAYAAPCLIVLVASPDPSAKIAGWEQLASATSCGYALVLAAQALGLGAIWKSTFHQNGTALRELCGCSEEERLLGWVLVGSRDPLATSAPRAIRSPLDPRDFVEILSPS